MNCASIFSLKDKVAVLTGAVGLLGRHFSRALASSGAAVVLVDLDAEICKKEAQQIEREFNTPTMGFACDVSLPEDVEAMVEATVERFGRIDVLHNNAAGKSKDLKSFFAPFEEYSLETWREIMATNLDGMFLVARAVGKQMCAQASGGSIVQTSSIYGICAPDHRIYLEDSELGDRKKR